MQTSSLLPILSALGLVVASPVPSEVAASGSSLVERKEWSPPHFCLRTHHAKNLPVCQPPSSVAAEATYAHPDPDSIPSICYNNVWQARHNPECHPHQLTTRSIASQEEEEAKGDDVNDEAEDKKS